MARAHPCGIAPEQTQDQGFAGGHQPLISRADANAIKGIAILLMFTHHLFALPTLIRPPSSFEPLLAALPLEYHVGRLGKICVAVFIFLSGYGFMQGAAAPDIWQRHLRKAGRFLGTYAFYFALAGLLVLTLPSLTPGDERLASIAGHLSLQGLFTLGKPLVYEWWFAQTYLALILLFPILARLTKRLPWLIGLALLAFLSGAFLDGRQLNPALFSFTNLLIWQLPFAYGMAFARMEMRPLPRGRANLGRLAMGASLVLGAGFLLIETAAPKVLTPFLIVACPLALPSLIACGRTPASRAPLAWLGQHSLPLWLIHPFLCTYLAQEWIYAGRHSLLILASLLAQTALLAFTLEAARSAFVSHLSRARLLPA
ncbi:acyltransferase [Novosphingobium sp. BW1]|uniref:acyltransferase family protein n=1 Tax=Novosphingobium sp. BW1 TaxID=2592621 RepID=UPI0013969E34|nr:acyltransferase [Novosphingobium sp. BW1]